MDLCGFTKTTLLDFPGKIAACVFFGGCNFRCPFCHNKDLVLHPASCIGTSKQEVYAFLEKRRNVLEGVCITGGEPTLYPHLADFIRPMRTLGYEIKLDTNGTNPAMLSALLADGLLDYIAMDIKNAPEKYAPTCGLSDSDFDLSLIQRSAALVQESGISYEFRTTVVKEFHEDSDFYAIGEWLMGASAYVLQSFEDGEQVLCTGLHAHTQERLTDFARILRKFVTEVSIRGVTEADVIAP